jgi:hypothetical protein
MELAERLALSDEPRDRAYGVAIIARGLSDEDGKRAGWPLDISIVAAIRYLGLPEEQWLLDAAAEMAPKISDATLNKGASERA